MTISNYDDLIDSRDVIERIEDLEELLACPDVIGEYRGEFQMELDRLKPLAEKGQGSPDWHYGEILIRDSYFVEYAQQLAEDIGAVPSDLGWPACHIDWDSAAEDLQQDYSCIDFDGVDYWIRS